MYASKITRIFFLLTAVIAAAEGITSTMITLAPPARCLDQITTTTQHEKNPMGGSVAGTYKTVMSEQCVREANHGPQPNPLERYLSWAASGFQGTRRQHEAHFRV